MSFFGLKLAMLELTFRLEMLLEQHFHPFATLAADVTITSALGQLVHAAAQTSLAFGLAQIGRAQLLPCQDLSVGNTLGNLGS
ncbi:unnamed protein product [Prunus armeniaca]